ncbi:hypothetical protein [Methylobacter tundripaludum]|uniref:hypothetical protein n=1 Tax=Methylobacter tundripaludum TaxID=173365 RepID=UPI0004DF80EE|nr:hypothetical protein [Methylobacter tundripaludum]
MNRVEQLKTRINALYALVLFSQSQRGYYVAAGLANPLVLDAFDAELNALKRDGREAVFDLLISGISHRQFMKFIKELNHG